METDPEFSEVISQLPGGRLITLKLFLYGIGQHLAFTSKYTYSENEFVFLVHSGSPQTTMPAVSTVVVSHTALLLNEILQNSLSSLFLHWVGYRSSTPVKLQGGCEITSL